MENITSNLSRISISTPETFKDVLEVLRQWLSNNPVRARSLTANRDYGPTNPDLYEDTQRLRSKLPESIQRFFSRQKPKEYTAEQIESLKKLDLAEFMLEVFRPDADDVNPPKSSYPVSWMASVLHDAFTKNVPRGDVPTQLLETLEELEEKGYKPAVFYGKIIAALQSSAVGKTYTLYQLAKLALSVTICLRSILADLDVGTDPDQGWPPQDQPACEFFRDNEDWTGEELAGAFLGGLFEVMNEKLNKLKTNSLGEFNAEWSIQDPTKIYESTRHETFVQVRDAAKNLLERHETALLAARAIIPKKEQTEHSPPEWHEEIHEILIRDRLASLLATHQKLNLWQSRLLVIAFDECTELNQLKGSDGNNSYPQKSMSLIALQRMMKTCEKHPDAPSARLRADHSPLAPWPYFGFDLMVDKSLLEGPQPARHGLSLEHWKVYGRPYWNIVPKHVLLDSADRKLFATHTGMQHDDALHVLAAFSQRVLVELANTEAARSRAIESVRKHMRILLGVVDRRIVHTVAPSEPMLAVAAARALLGTKGGYQKATQIFVDKVMLQKDVLHTGDLGELLARMILTLARDGALGDSPFTTNLEVTPVSVSQFLKKLVNDTLISAKLDDFAKQYVMNFSHFYQLSRDTSVLNPKFLKKCWLRGVALQGSHNQPVWDILIPAYKSSELDAPFDVKNIFLLVVQVKCRATASPVEYLTAPFITEEKTRFKPPHIALLMDLATASTFTNTKKFVSIDFSVAVPPKSSSGKGKDVPKAEDASKEKDLPGGSTTKKRGAPKKKNGQKAEDAPKEEEEDATLGADGNAAKSKVASKHTILRTFFSETYSEHKRWFIRLRGRTGDVYPVLQKLGPALSEDSLYQPLEPIPAAKKFMHDLDPLSATVE
ncbi:hypothetical protein HGRIS_001823 [Hohenbuehelia grisea]|uniref:Uncharacterized protein n=1 Tax=Hohenbuehelia grisea TaxID=104357 RepID=A0ABR3JIS1_9AGAR